LSFDVFLTIREHKRSEQKLVEYQPADSYVENDYCRNDPDVLLNVADQSPLNSSHHGKGKEK